MTSHRHTKPPTESQLIIVNYARKHPGCQHKEISRETGFSAQYIWEIIRDYAPELAKKRNMTGGPSAMQEKIVAIKNANPDMTQKEISQRLGVAPATVSIAISTFIHHKFPPVKTNHKKKSSAPFTLRPCLGLCGGLHESTGRNDRICPKCKGRQAYQYAPEYEVSAPGFQHRARYRNG
jgi:predicted transcriptional regulator